MREIGEARPEYGSIQERSGEFVGMTGKKIQRARTKTVATVGPASNAPEQLNQLIQCGVDVFRINTAHGTADEHDQIFHAIRAASEQQGRPVAILVDLAGPKIRLGNLFTETVDCPVGRQFRFVRNEVRSADELTCSYDRLIDELSVDNQVMLADGSVTMVVESVTQDQATCRVISGGTIRSRQGVNLPGVALSLSAVTEKDKERARWAASVGADFVSQSFVRNAEEIIALKSMLTESGSDAAVIAKIEKREALEALEPIVEAADGVMVARGDLGVEIDVAETPVAQKRIIRVCQRLCKPVIVATQMLESMHDSRRPTRAEASDVANAILDGADACMLSGETAIGQYPVDAVNMMQRIMAATERMLEERPELSTTDVLDDVHIITSAVVNGAGKIAEDVNARLVVVATRSGATARVKSKQHSLIPTIGVSASEATLRRMCLYWGITPLRGAPVMDPPSLRNFIASWGKEHDVVQAKDRVVFVTGTGLVADANNLLVVHEIR